MVYQLTYNITKKSNVFINFAGINSKQNLFYLVIYKSIINTIEHHANTNIMYRKQLSQSDGARYSTISR